MTNHNMRAAGEISIPGRFGRVRRLPDESAAPTLPQSGVQTMEREQASSFVQELLRVMLARKASDLFFNAGFPPAVKIDGRLTPLSDKPLSSEYTSTIVRAIMNDRQLADFEATKESNFAISPSGIGRFRVNAFIQRGDVGVVIRSISTSVPRLADLGTPKVLSEVAMMKRGLVLIVGATGSGKSTTLAAMVDLRNATGEDHIITIEDPIEYLYENKRSMVSQREVGADTESWAAALKNTLRQAPDVIVIGEIRDRETMEHAIAFSETGHLCLATLHSNNANQALDRIINFFPDDRRKQLLLDLSLNLAALISQRLIPLKEGKGRVAAVEVLLRSALVQDLIRDGKIPELRELMKRSRETGMQTFDQSLFDLYEAGRIDEDEALRYADSVNDLRLLIKYQSVHAHAPAPGSEGGGMSIEPGPGAPGRYSR